MLQGTEGEAARFRRGKFLTSAGFLLCVLPASPALAQSIDFDLHGYAEGILADTPETRSPSDGGLGKVRWGGTGTSGRVDPEISALLLEGTASLPFDLHAAADIRYDPKQKSAVDLLDASLQWRPPASGAWSWSAKIGAFFPPFGLENQDIGWSSPWTLTYSALDSWIGEELRTIGGEGTVRWRGEEDTFAITGSVFGWNDPAGVLLADRGWDLTSRSLGLYDHQREPDITAALFGNRPPYYTPEFNEIDNKPGWYAGLSWDRPGIGHVQLYRYDNAASPAERNNVYSWRTRFWDLGYTRGFGPFYVIAEGMTGDTSISPDGFGPFVTDFHAAYLLGGWTHDAWRLVLRVEQFGTSGQFSERGRAVTAALTWMPEDWLRLTAEIVTVDSVRSERALTGQSPHAIETEPQLGVRLSF